MDRKQLGKRIKEIRLSKKLTQSEVVGTFITRNMLSQIESGNASPSMKTLEYLAGVLEVPLNLLVSEVDPELIDEGTPAELSLLLSAKQLYGKNDFHAAIRAADDLMNTNLSDEASAIIARSYLRLSEDNFNSGQYGKAHAEAEKAADLADRGIYASREIKTAALILLEKISDRLIGKNSG